MYVFIYCTEYTSPQLLSPLRQCKARGMWLLLAAWDSLRIGRRGGAGGSGDDDDAAAAFVESAVSSSCVETMTPQAILLIAVHNLLDVSRLLLEQGDLEPHQVPPLVRALEFSVRRVPLLDPGFEPSSFSLATPSSSSSSSSSVVSPADGAGRDYEEDMDVDEDQEEATGTGIGGGETSLEEAILMAMRTSRSRSRYGIVSFPLSFFCPSSFNKSLNPSFNIVLFLSSKNSRRTQTSDDVLMAQAAQGALRELCGGRELPRLFDRLMSNNGSSSSGTGTAAVSEV